MVFVVCAVVVLCGTSAFVRDFVLKAYTAGMTNGDYVYISLCQMPPDNLKTPWINNDSKDAQARLAFASVLQVDTTKHKFYIYVCMYIYTNI